MTCIVITSIKEKQTAVASIFAKAGIPVYSSFAVEENFTEQLPDLMEEWFSAGEAKVAAIACFSFTNAALATHALQLVNTYNQSMHIDFPLKAYVLPVTAASEKAIQL